MHNFAFGYSPHVAIFKCQYRDGSALSCQKLSFDSTLNSQTLREEITNFNKLLVRFFNGEFYELLTEHSDKAIGWEFQNEVIVDNSKLR